mgnify:CR=1 FL=1|tara:strand:+ start:75 stop:305 length:231 start_codon:yes stop_codon:yes gene_type:complete
MNGPTIFFFLLLAIAGFIVFVSISKNDMGIVALKGNDKNERGRNNPEIIFNNIYADKKADQIDSDETTVDNKEPKQ